MIASISTVAYPDAKARRDAARAAGVCINGAQHPPVMRGGKCARCLAVHSGRPLMSAAERVYLSCWRLRKELREIARV